METFINIYLSRHYKVSTTEESSKKIQLLVTYGIYKKSDDQDLVYCEDLIAELSGVFDLKELEATKFINDWSITQDRWVDLTWYWSHKKIWLPEITRVVARTIQQYLIGVEPMKGPTAKLMYFDYQYSGGTDKGDTTRRL